MKIKDVRARVFEWRGPTTPPQANFCSNAADMLPSRGDTMKSFRFYSWTVVEIETDNGLIGLGNVALAPRISKAIIDEYLKPLVIGEDPWDYEYLSHALATMGAGLPSAMMAAMLFPERRVMAVCGDGGFMMNSQEMETAVRLKLNLVVLILEDSAYGMIRWKQAVDSFPDFGLSFGNPDFVKYAESYGAKGSRVESADGLVPTLERAFKGGAVHLVVVPIDYTENSRVLIDELREKLEKVAEPVA